MLFSRLNETTSENPSYVKIVDNYHRTQQSHLFYRPVTIAPVLENFYTVHRVLFTIRKPVSCDELETIQEKFDFSRSSPCRYSRSLASSGSDSQVPTFSNITLLTALPLSLNGYLNSYISDFRARSAS